MQTRYDHDANILTTLEKIITAAGFVSWQKPMPNLRATGESELLAHYPTKDVTSWLGNSPDVANKHYAMAMQDSFTKAIIEGAIGVSEKTPQKTPHSMPSNGNPGQSWAITR